MLAETVEGFFGEFGPAGLGVDGCGLEVVGPESAGEGNGGETSEGFTGMLGFLLLIDLLEGFGVVLGQPVETDGAAVAAVMEGSGAPGGEFEDGGTAEAPMGDEEGALLFEFVLGEGYFDLGDGDAGELGELGVADIKGEEGGDGGNDAVAEGLGETIAAGMTAGGQEEAIAVSGFSVTETDAEALGMALDGLDGGLGFESDSGALGGVEEALGDGCGVVGGGEHSPVGFGFEGYALLGKPVDGVLGLEAAKGTP